MGKETTNCPSGEQIRVTCVCVFFSFAFARCIESKRIPTELPGAARLGYTEPAGGLLWEPAS